MKQGSTDDPFADDAESDADARGDVRADAESDAPADETSDAASDTDTDAPAGTDVSESRTTDRGSDASATGGSGDDRSEQGRLPYIYARESVKDGRQQRPIFLRDDVEDGIPVLVDDLEATFDENVYRTDVMEAAVEIAQEHPDLVADKLREWGYGWD